ncbi:hypothetical protein VTO73DRAFT_4576 [Trametes versicolor]
MSQFSRPHPDSANNRPRLSPADNIPIASRTPSESVAAAYSDEEAPAYSLVHVPERERGFQAVPRSLLPWRIMPEEAHRDRASRTATAYQYLLMVALVRIIAASIAFSHSTAISTSDNGDAGENLHDNDVNDEGHILSGGPEQPAASRDFEPVAEARPSNSTRGGGKSGHKRSLEGTDNSASSATNAEGDRHEGPVGDDDTILRFGSVPSLGARNLPNHHGAMRGDVFGFGSWSQTKPTVSARGRLLVARSVAPIFVSYLPEAAVAPQPATRRRNTKMPRTAPFISAALRRVAESFHIRTPSACGDLPRRAVIVSFTASNHD